jgi:DNA polymerase/3'-5' exonuclease PolX
MIPLATAEALAREVCALLAPACEEIAIVGSIRRRKAEVKDIEILARPKPPRPVFGEPRSAGTQLEALVGKLIDQRALSWRGVGRERKDGSKWKTLSLPRMGGVPIDLFIAHPSGANWGNLLAIRTGDWEWSRQLVTSRHDGGLMPPTLVHREGYLRHRADNALIRCRTEDSFFAALGIRDIPDPAARTLATARRLAAQLKREKVRT